jgi:hypothetical protein
VKATGSASLGSTVVPEPVRTPEPASEPAPSRGRWWRNAVTLLLLAGTIGGVALTDDAWPFAPFRMFTTAPGPTTRVLAVHFDAVTVDGRKIQLKADHFGLRRAEIEGQLNSDRDLDPDQLQALFENYNQWHSGADRLAQLTLVLAGWKLEEGRPKEPLSVRKATWPKEVTG